MIPFFLPIYICRTRTKTLEAHAILLGRIVERQKDRESGEWKYRIAGPAQDRELIETAVKLSLTRKLVVITVYRV